MRLDTILGILCIVASIGLVAGFHLRYTEGFRRRWSGGAEGGNKWYKLLVLLVVLLVVWAK